MTSFHHESPSGRCGTCEECPAIAICYDDSLAGQIARLLVERRPAIVLTSQVEALVKASRSVRSIDTRTTENNA
jgi:hypothetical protein